MSISRRRFLTLTGTTTASVILASLLKNFYTNVAGGQSLYSKGFGKIISDSNKILDLPQGFRYQILSQAGDRMTDGTRVPTNHDGMAAFRRKDGRIILIRNHELSPGEASTVIASDDKKYDKFSNGGTTTLILNEEYRVIQEFVSLAGTNRNCAGGSTPWGTWISSEEDTANTPIKHGYNFEVSTSKTLNKPVPLIEMGRFRHEAVAVDPMTGYIYQTEDRPDGCFYRFRPKKSEQLQAGGILEALVIEGMPSIDTSVGFIRGQPQKASWIEIENKDPDEDTLRYEAQKKGAAIFKRGEGICLGDGQIYWTCTNGGKAQRGQIFRYDPSRQTVELFLESQGEEMLDYPDNIILSPFGHLIVCEDGGGEQFLVGITPEGKYYRFARNALNNSEFAGACFSPNGQTMFVNIYSPGITLAIWGDWDKFS